MLNIVITNKNTKVSGLVLLKNFKKRARKGSKLEPYCMWTRPLCIPKVVGKGTYIISTVARILQIFLALCSPYNMTRLKLHYDLEEEPTSSSCKDSLNILCKQSLKYDMLEALL